MFAITTERLILKVIDQSYANSVLEYYKRNQSFLDPWDPIKSDDFYTLKQQKLILGNQLYDMQVNNSLCLWIFIREQPNYPIGYINFSSIIRAAFQSCFLGYKLDHQFINNGYMTEAIAAGIDTVFNRLKLHRIEANIMPRNLASRRVVEKLGFINEGLSKKLIKINGIWEDHLHYVLLNDEIE